MAAQRRSTVKRKIPVHLFIDEVYDYIPNTSDSNILTIIEQCRKQMIALTVAHQNCDQLSQRTIGTFQTCAIKAVSSLTPKDAAIMAPGMKAKPQDLQDQPRGTFMVSVRGTTSRPVSLEVTPYLLEHMERMTDAAYEELKANMRARYAAAKNEGHARAQQPPKPAEQVDHEHDRASMPPADVKSTKPLPPTASKDTDEIKAGTFETKRRRRPKKTTEHHTPPPEHTPPQT